MHIADSEQVFVALPYFTHSQQEEIFPFHIFVLRVTEACVTQDML